MGIPVLIIGESGSGKTTSLRNFEPNEIGVFSVSSKPLPFRKKLPVMKPATYQSMYKAWERGRAENHLRKVYAIDDSSLLMTFSSFSRAKETGYGKFTDFALDFYNLVQYVITKLPDDVLVYFLHHMERTDAGTLKAKTVGKMLDNQLTLEALFTIVLFAQTDGKDHWFVTQSDGFTTAKSPMDMFPEKIDNDLKAVDSIIREYYEFPALNAENDTKEQEKTA